MQERFISAKITPDYYHMMRLLCSLSCNEICVSSLKRKELSKLDCVACQLH